MSVLLNVAGLSSLARGLVEWQGYFLLVVETYQDVRNSVAALFVEPLLPASWTPIAGPVKDAALLLSLTYFSRKAFAWMLSVPLAQLRHATEVENERRRDEALGDIQAEVSRHEDLGGPDQLSQPRTLSSIFQAFGSIESYKLLLGIIFGTVCAVVLSFASRYFEPIDIPVYGLLLIFPVFGVALILLLVMSTMTENTGPADTSQAGRSQSFTSTALRGLLYLVGFCAVGAAVLALLFQTAEAMSIYESGLLLTTAAAFSYVAAIGFGIADAKRLARTEREFTLSVALMVAPVLLFALAVFVQWQLSTL
ncbi:MAG: hypothetical protein ACKVRO_15230 [Micropepsaceae bacterium]